MKKIVLLVAIVFTGLVGFSQKADSIMTKVSGAVTATNNGISLVPAFSLGKPAAIFDLSVQRKKFSFDPQLAFGVRDAKPWYFVFWLRYKLIESSKFNVGIAMHPGFLFSTQKFNVNSLSKEYMTTSRFFVGCLTPNYLIANNVSVGLYLQQAKGYNSDLKNAGFYGINMNFSNISLGKEFFMRATPQLYYLKNDDLDGSYFSANITLAKRNNPLSISTLLNTKIQSNIPSDNFLWNISLTYAF